LLDGITYSNECDAAAAGARITHDGTCPGEGACGTIAGIPCPDGMFCDLPPGRCLVADEAGTCVPRANSCIAIYLPVCGCDGVTYSNDCHRIAARVTKAHDGECR
jgi:hypothetical protein